MLYSEYGKRNIAFPVATPALASGVGVAFSSGINVLLVVTIRSEGQRYALGHISDSGSTRVFCGVHVPASVLECGLENPGNPYVGKVPVSCAECISEYNNGRRDGFREKMNQIDRSGVRGETG